MAEVSAVEGRLRQHLSSGYGFTGFLISWLAGGNPLGILFMAFLLAVITSVGDILQITQGLPFAVINILLALILFVVLARPTQKGKATSAGRWLKGSSRGRFSPELHCFMPPWVRCSWRGRVSLTWALKVSC